MRIAAYTKGVALEAVRRACPGEDAEGLLRPLMALMAGHAMQTVPAAGAVVQPELGLFLGRYAPGGYPRYQPPGPPPGAAQALAPAAAGAEPKRSSPT